MPRFAQNDLLELLELMDAKDTFRVFAMTSRFATEAWRIRKEFERKILFLQYFFHVVPHRCHFRSAGKVVAVLCFIEVLFALRQIAGAYETLAPYERRNDHRREALVGEFVLHQVLQSPHQARAVSL